MVLGLRTKRPPDTLRQKTDRSRRNSPWRSKSFTGQWRMVRYRALVPQGALKDHIDESRSRRNILSERKASGHYRFQNTWTFPSASMVIALLQSIEANFAEQHFAQFPYSHIIYRLFRSAVRLELSTSSLRGSGLASH